MQRIFGYYGERPPFAGNSITESESLAVTLANIYEEAGLPAAAAWEASLADLECLGAEKTGARRLQMAEPATQH